MSKREGARATERRHWRVLGEEVLFDASPWFKVTRETLLLPDGRRIPDYYQVIGPSYVEVVPVRADGRIQCQWRYKHGPRRASLGLPGGYIEGDEQALDAAQRELHEEAGLTSGEWVDLGAFAIDGNRGPAEAHLFLAWNCGKAARIPSDDLESGEPVWLTAEELEAHLREGAIATLGVAAAVLLALPLIRKRYGGDRAASTTRRR
jgi:ADP-ribose diphosphatase